jgi:peptidoglycan hydrolase-like protein with peptidoglycan-binding domain
MQYKTILIIIVVALALGAAIFAIHMHFGSEALTANNGGQAASSSTAPIAPQSIVLSLGSKSVMVTAVQQALIKEGYLKGSPTGVYGTSTQVAVEKFQQANNLTVTGDITIASNSVTSSLRANAPAFVTIGPTSSPAEISRIQAYFITIGYLKIAAATGVYGPATEAAVKTFQKAHGVPQTGVIDEATFAAMNGK